MQREVLEYLKWLAVAGLVLALDQGSKALVRATLPYGAAWSPWPWLQPYIRVVHWGNTGVAFGLFQRGGDFFTLLAVVVSLLLVVTFPRIPREDRAMRLVLALMLGGALGNLVDRLTIGHVTDFIAVGAFPVFNLADASISIGAAIMVVLSYVRERRGAAGGEALPEAPAEEAHE